MNGRPTCGQCDHWEDMTSDFDDYAWGECYYFPPVLLMSEEGGIAEGRPSPAADCRACAQFKAKQ